MKRLICLFIFISALLFGVTVSNTAPTGFQNPLTYERFQNLYAFEWPQSPGAYEDYLRVLMDAMLSLGFEQTPGFKVLVELLRIEKLRTIPDVLHLEELLEPLKRNDPPLEPEDRQQAYTYMKSYLGNFRLFNLRNQLLKNVDEQDAMRDYGDRVTSEIRQKYRAIKDDLLEQMNAEDKTVFQEALNKAAIIDYEPMNFLCFKSLYGEYKSSWAHLRSIFRQYLKDTYEAVDVKKLEERQYKMDVWTFEGSQGIGGTPDLNIAERATEDVTIVVAPFSRELSPPLKQQAKQYLLVVLFKLSRAGVEELATARKHKSLRASLMKELDATDLQALNRRDASWAKVVEQVNIEKGEEMLKPKKHYEEPMSYEVYSQTYGPEYNNRVLYRLYAKDIIERTDATSAEVLQARQDLWTQLGADGIREITWTEAFPTWKAIAHIRNILNGLRKLTESVAKNQAYEYLLASLYKLSPTQINLLNSQVHGNEILKELKNVLTSADMDLLTNESLFNSAWKKIFKYRNQASLTSITSPIEGRYPSSIEGRYPSSIEGRYPSSIEGRYPSSNGEPDFSLIKRLPPLKTSSNGEPDFSLIKRLPPLKTSSRMRPRQTDYTF